MYTGPVVTRLFSKESSQFGSGPQVRVEPNTRPVVPLLKVAYMRWLVNTAGVKAVSPT